MVGNQNPHTQSHKPICEVIKAPFFLFVFLLHTIPSEAGNIALAENRILN